MDTKTVEYEPVKHLEFIGNIIARMASTSSLMKGWNITLIVGVFAISDKESICRLTPLLIFSNLMFMFFDMYYLQLERKFRKLYNKVAEGQTNSFSMSLTNCKVNYLKVGYSWSIFPFYGTILISIVLLRFLI